MPIEPMSPVLGTRAVERLINAGCLSECVSCEKQVKFQAKMRNKQVIANVYVDGRWARVEHYHSECYTREGQPHGAPDRAQADALQKRSRQREAMG